MPHFFSTRSLGAAILLCLLFQTGCESLPTRLADRFSTDAPQEREVETGRDKVYAAAQTALERMSFKVTRAREAQGIVEGRSAILSSDRFSESQQYDFEIRLRDYGDDLTRVSVWLREQAEGSFKAGPSREIIRDHALYDSFFAALNAILLEQGDLPSANPVRGLPQATP